MPGKIVRIAVTENSQVQEGDALLIMEAMKMQNELKAPRHGKVLQILVSEGAPVSSQQVLIVME
jgi:biotin carboxyl carrier protein